METANIMKTKVKQLLIIQIFLYSFSNNSFAQKPGDLDSTFGNNGKVITSIGTIQDFPSSIALQKDGKIVVGGQTYSSAYSDFALIRYNKNGMIDTSFGKKGKVTTDINKEYDDILKVSIQADGKILVVGASTLNGNSDFAIGRYNPNGSLDTSFSKDGLFTLDISKAYDAAWSSVFQLDGKIVVAGEANGSFAVIRLKSNGSLDTAYGVKGISKIDFKSFGAKGYCAGLQTDGKVVVSGYSFVNNKSTGFAATRLKTNGSLDSTFSKDGILITKFDTVYDEARSLVIQPDGKIILAGYTESSSNKDFALARYKKDGTLDSSFHFDGKVTTKLGTDDEEIYSIALQQDNKIVVAGYSKSNLDKDFALARYNVDGSLDSTFSSDGKLTCGIENSDDQSFSVAIQSDGKIVATGYSRASSMSALKFALARFISGLSLGIMDFSELKNDVYLYPNPIGEKTNLNYILKHEETITIYLTDINGKLLKTFIINEKQKPGEYNQQLELPENLVTGIYFLTLSTATGKLSIKIVK